jgi:hypothetical protein
MPRRRRRGAGGDAAVHARPARRATGGAARVRLSELAGGGSGDVPRRWLDVARAAHLGGGRGLRAAGFGLEEADGDVRLGNEERGLAAPDGWITRRR